MTGLRYGILSDIHSNLEALEVAIDSLSDADAFICLGDIVGYGPNPNECCEIIRSHNAVNVLGNHDAATTGNLSLEWFSHLARDAAEWTIDNLSAENQAYLQSIPYTHRIDGAVMVHGTLDSPEDFKYMMDELDSERTFEDMAVDIICLIGHTHVAEYYQKQSRSLHIKKFSMTYGGVIELKPDMQIIVNCGSVGQPRDGNRAASFGLYDSDAATIEIRRQSYPVEVTQKKMRDAGLQERLWTRLQYGM